MLSVPRAEEVSDVRRSEMIKPVFENSRSLDTDVAGIPKYARATCDRLGYLEAFLAHHLSVASSHDTGILGSTSR